MRKQISIITLLLVSAAFVSPNLSFAQDYHLGQYGGPKPGIEERQDFRQEHRDERAIRQDRAVVHQVTREYRQDRENARQNIARYGINSPQAEAARQAARQARQAATQARQAEKQAKFQARQAAFHERHVVNRERNHR